MKTARLLYVLFSVLLLAACNGTKSPGNEDSTHAEPAVKTASFSKIENLPPGIDTIFGNPPSKENGFYKFSFPRTDLKVKADGIGIDARLAFTTWFAFMAGQSDIRAMLMGDIVLL